MKVAGIKSASKSKETRDDKSQENTASHKGNCELYMHCKANKYYLLAYYQVCMYALY